METTIMKNKSALVIGASGMVGTALMKVLGRSKTYFSIKGVDIETDMTIKSNTEIIKDYDHIYHLAGKKGSPQTAKERPADYLPMLQFDTNIIEAVGKYKPEWFLYTSSIGVYPPMEVDSIVEQFNNMEDFLLYLEKCPKEQHFSIGFRYGELTLSQDELNVVTQKMARAPRSVQDPLWDGYGHGHAWEEHSIEENWSTVQQYISNRNHRDIVSRGMVYHHLQQNIKNLSKMNESINYYETLFPIVSIQDGLRIVLQRNLKEAEVLSKIHLFDKKYQIPIAEELGWRVGDEHFQKNLAKKESWNYDNSLYCTFVQGIARGYVMQNYLKQKQSFTIEQLRKLNQKHPTCRPYIWRGVGFAFHLLNITQTTDLKTLLEEDEFHWFSVSSRDLIWSSP